MTSLLRPTKAAAAASRRIASISASSLSSSTAALASHFDRTPSDPTTAFSDARDRTVLGLLRAFAGGGGTVRTAAAVMEAGALRRFASDYFAAVERSYRAGNSEYTPEVAAERFGGALELAARVGVGPGRFSFGVRHEAVRGGTGRDDGGGDDDESAGRDLYAFGCDFFRPIMDLDRSVVLGADGLRDAFDRVRRRGENAVFLANHQSDADPQVLSCLLETVGCGDEATELTFVAGHRVTSDAVAIPFSMGRNLLCVHSPRHVDEARDGPEATAAKRRRNRAAAAALLGMLREGGTALWVAPSGGRDLPRRDDINCDGGGGGSGGNGEVKVPVADFDRGVVDLFRAAGLRSGVRTRYYPMAISSYDLCPPPDAVEACGAVGEERTVRFAPVGVAVGDELAMEEGDVARGMQTTSRQGFAEMAQRRTEELYAAVLRELEEKKKEKKLKKGEGALFAQNSCYELKQILG